MTEQIQAGSIEYRNLQPEEAEAFWNMMNELDNETNYMLYEPGEREQKAKNFQMLQSVIESSLYGENFLLAAVCEGEIIGYISAKREILNRTRHTAYIVVGIREKFRGIGIGTEFFRRLELWAKQKNIKRLELTVLCPNLPAKHLYEKSGFIIEGIKKNSVLLDGKYTDEYYMAKILE